MSCRLRLLRESDLETVMRWRMKPEVSQYMYTDPVLTIDGQRRWYDRIRASDRDRVWIIELTDGDRAVGLLSLSEIDRVNSRCSWAYYLGETDVRGAGLARALEMAVYGHVFDTLGLNKLCCEVLASNERVVALHEKFGSRVEGVARQHIRKNGVFLDVVRMGMLAADWPAVRERFKPSAMPIEDPTAAGSCEPALALEV